MYSFREVIVFAILTGALGFLIGYLIGDVAFQREIDKGEK